jgi:hypothetical protein
MCNKILLGFHDMDWITAHFSFPEDEDGDGPRNVGFIYI